MKIQRLVVVAGMLAAVAALASVILISHWQYQPAIKNLPKLITALQSYSRDRVSHGQPLPASVTLRDLANGGYLSTNDVQAFDGMNVTFYPARDTATDAQAILIRVRMPDGSQVVGKADGSIALAK